MDTLIIRFKNRTNAVGLNLLSPRFSGEFIVEIYSGSLIIDTSSIMASQSTEFFWGAVTNQYITSVKILTPNNRNNGGMLTNLSFGLCKERIRIIPAMKVWAIICLGTIMLIIGVVAVGQKEMAIA